MNGMRKIIFFVVILASLTTPALALNVQTHRYYFQTGRTDILVESLPKEAETLTLGISTNLSLHPFRFGQSLGALSPQNVVSTIFTFDLGATYSFSDRFAVSINIPSHVTHNIRSLTDTSVETVMSFGDFGIAAQYTILPPIQTRSGIGVAVVPYITFPTGTSSNFIGDSSSTGGFLVVADKEYNGNYFGVNMGFRFREGEDFLNLRVAQEFLYTLAYERPIIDKFALSGFGEFSGSTVMNDFFQKQNSSPVEFKIGASMMPWPDNPVTLKFVNGFGIGNGYGNPDYRAVLSVTYDHVMPHTKVIEKTVTVNRVQEVEQRLKELTIYYPTGKSQVDPAYDLKISGIARVMKENSSMGPLYIVGHTDDIGDDVFNRKLSEKRAKQAYESIVAQGLDPKRIVWFGVGESAPIVPNTTDANRALNRHTLFTFEKPGQLVGQQGVVVPVVAKPSMQIPTKAGAHTGTTSPKPAPVFMDDSQAPLDDSVLEAVPVRESVTTTQTLTESKDKPHHFGNMREHRTSHSKLNEKNLDKSTPDATTKDAPTSGDEKQDFDEPFVE